ncbi:MAG: 50S ribosomal protein L25 [Actinomycetota bacterium]|nr:50S ribosomal protein L25 [Actinomycetota bacterium]
MPEIPLDLESRTDCGSRESRRLRGRGRVPGVVYGHTVDPIPVSVDSRELRRALGTEVGSNALLALSVGGGTHLALAREIQRHPVRQNVLHVDFHVVSRYEPVPAEVPLILVGDAIEVHHGDGIVEQQLFSLAIHALPTEIPSGIEVDVSKLTIGSVIRVAELQLPPGVASVDTDAEASVVAGHPPRVHVEEGGAEAVGEEGAAGGAPSAAGAGAGGAGDGGG